MLLILFILLTYACAFFFVIGVMPSNVEKRPTLEVLGIDKKQPKKKKRLFKDLIRNIALINRPLAAGPLGQRMQRSLTLAKVNLSPEEFLLVKEIIFVVLMFLALPLYKPDTIFAIAMFCFAGAYMIPEFYMNGRIQKIKAAISRELPDSIDLLSLCVNAGLDFMLSLKWVVDKSPPSVMVDELNGVLQEINIGKTRRDALRDLAAKYEIPDLSTFSRTLIQADKMGTSVTDALNILSEDMRISRFRRGERIAMQAPLKMLIPLIFGIFPSVFIIIGVPIFLDFSRNNPFKAISGG